jgi:hypothetical protein
MCAHLIIILCVRAQDATQVPLTEYHKVVNALTADRANQPFGKTVLPWRSAEIGLSRIPIARSRRLTTVP